MAVQSIVVEDGSLVSGANSYVTTAEITQFAENTGQSTGLPTAESELAVLAYKAMQKIEAYRGRFKGIKRDDDQALQWPRYNVYIDQYIFDSDEIPQILKDAQCQFAIDANSNDLTPNTKGNRITEKKVGPINVKYASNVSSNVQPNFNKAMNLLQPLLNNGVVESWRY